MIKKGPPTGKSRKLTGFLQHLKIPAIYTYRLRQSRDGYRGIVSDQETYDSQRITLVDVEDRLPKETVILVRTKGSLFLYSRSLNCWFVFKG